MVQLCIVPSAPSPGTVWRMITTLQIQKHCNHPSLPLSSIPPKYATKRRTRVHRELKSYSLVSRNRKKLLYKRTTYSGLSLPLTCWHKGSRVFPLAPVNTTARFCAQGGVLRLGWLQRHVVSAPPKERLVTPALFWNYNMVSTHSPWGTSTEHHHVREQAWATLSCRYLDEKELWQRSISRGESSLLPGPHGQGWAMGSSTQINCIGSRTQTKPVIHH